MYLVKYSSALNFLLGILGIIMIFSGCTNSERIFQKQKYVKGQFVKKYSPDQSISPSSDNSSETDLPVLLITVEKIDTNFNSEKRIEKLAPVLQQAPLVNEMVKPHLQPAKTLNHLIKGQKIIQKFENEPEENSVQKHKKEYGLFLLVLLCFLLPFLAVGLKTNWDLVLVIITFLLMITWPIAVVLSLLIIYEII